MSIREIRRVFLCANFPYRKPISLSRPTRPLAEKQSRQATVMIYGWQNLTWLNCSFSNSPVHIRGLALICDHIMSTVLSASFCKARILWTLHFRSVPVVTFSISNWIIRPKLIENLCSEYLCGGGALSCRPLKSNRSAPLWGAFYESTSFVNRRNKWPLLPIAINKQERGDVLAICGDGVNCPQYVLLRFPDERLVALYAASK